MSDAACCWSYRHSAAHSRGQVKKTLRYCVGANAQRTAQSIWAAFQQHGAAKPTAPVGEAVLDAERNKMRNNDPPDDQKTSRPGRTRTYDQGIMSPLL